MNSEMHFLPTMYAQDHHQLQHEDERFIGRPFGYGFGRSFGYGFGAPFLGGLVAGSLLSPYGYGGYGYGYGGYPYGGYGCGC